MLPNRPFSYVLLSMGIAFVVSFYAMPDGPIDWYASRSARLTLSITVAVTVGQIVWAIVYYYYPTPARLALGVFGIASLLVIAPLCRPFAQIAATANIFGNGAQIDAKIQPQPTSLYDFATMALGVFSMLVSLTFYRVMYEAKGSSDPSQVRAEKREPDGE